MLNETNLQKLRQPIDTTWQAVGPDAEELCEGDNDVAIEFCIDANRLAMFHSKEADDLVSSIVKNEGYEQTLRWLSDNIRLV